MLSIWIWMFQKEVFLRVFVNLEHFQMFPDSHVVKQYVQLRTHPHGRSHFLHVLEHVQFFERSLAPIGHE